MHTTILARIPADNGTRVGFSRTGGMTVGEAACERCGAPGANVIQGETDSFGFESVVLCDACLKREEEANEQYFSALDVENREPKDGTLFVISESTNHDGHGDWFRSFRSFREATAFYRMIERTAARFCGLYPGKGVREMPAAEVNRIQQRRNEALRREFAALCE